jgi:hypothetical protein
MERLAEISILVVCLGFILYGIYYAFRLWMRQNNIALSDITEPFRSISVFESALKFLLPTIFGLFIVSFLFGDTAYWECHSPDFLSMFLSELS